MIRKVGLLIIGISFLSCVKDKPEEDSEFAVVANSNAVIVGAEGNFQFGNASISLYNPGDSSIGENIFQKANDRPLGDVLQSIGSFGNLLYLVVNNSSKIEVVQKSDFKLVATIHNLKSPRYFLPVSNSKAYVTDLYANSISVVDLDLNEVQSQIKVSGWTEGLTMIYGKVFVSNKAKNLVYVIDAEKDELIDSIKVGASPSSLVQDKNSKLWVLGDHSIEMIDPVTLNIQKSITLDLQYSASRLSLNQGLDTLYFLGNGVQRMSVSSDLAPETVFIKNNSNNFYALEIDPKSNNIYLSDAIDYIQKSIVHVYSPSGNLLNSFTSGVNTSVFWFD